MANPLENVCEKLTHMHMVVYTWWCWHIYKGDKVGVDVDQLGDEMEARRVRYFTDAMYRKDRVSQSAPNAGHTVTERWGPMSGQWHVVKAALGLLTGRRRPDSG